MAFEVWTVFGFLDELNLLFQKYNLLFFGLAEEPDEDPEQLVRNILQTKMDIILKDKDIEFAEVRLFWKNLSLKADLQMQPLSSHMHFSYISTKGGHFGKPDLTWYCKRLI